MRSRTTTPAHERELNVLPYLDVLMNLIIFMLLSMTGLATYGAINVTRTGASFSFGEPAQPVEVALSAAGFVVHRGDQLTRVPRSDTGAPNYAGLTTALEAMKSGEADTKAQLRAAPDISYELVVGTLDAMRGSVGRRLFPDVALDAAR